MKQFEASIHKIASEVQSIDPVATGRDIARLTDSIDALHDRLGAHRRGPEPLGADQPHAHRSRRRERRSARCGARGRAGQRRLSTGCRMRSARVRSTRRTSRTRISRACARRGCASVPISTMRAGACPEPGAFPDARTMLQTHDDLVRFARLAGASRAGDVPMIADPGQETLERLHETSERIERIVAVARAHRRGEPAVDRGACHAPEGRRVQQRMPPARCARAGTRAGQRRARRVPRAAGDGAQGFRARSRTDPGGGESRRGPARVRPDRRVLPQRSEGETGCGRGGRADARRRRPTGSTSRPGSSCS